MSKNTNSFSDNPWITIIKEHPTNAERLKHYGIKIRQVSSKLEN